MVNPSVPKPSSYDHFMLPQPWSFRPNIADPRDLLSHQLPAPALPSVWHASFRKLIVVHGVSSPRLLFRSVAILPHCPPDSPWQWGRTANGLGIPLPSNGDLNVGSSLSSLFPPNAFTQEVHCVHGALMTCAERVGRVEMSFQTDLRCSEPVVLLLRTVNRTTLRSAASPHDCVRP